MRAEVEAARFLPSPASGRGEQRDRIVTLARGWIGTPYVHQASAQGQGTDCLGLIRGVWRALYGRDAELPPPYTPDWNERRSAEEPLLSAARRHLTEASPSPALAGEGKGVRAALQAPAPVLQDTPPHPRPLSRKRQRGEETRGVVILPAQILIFRILTDGPAKHCGIAAGEDRFIHAYAGRAVVESWLSRWWMERLAGVFEFPGVEG